MAGHRDLRSNVVVISLIIAAAVLLYGNTLHAPFEFDDSLTIVENPLIKDSANVQKLFFYDPSRFITHLSFAVNYNMGRLNVAGYHVVNILLHTLVGIVFYLFLRLACLGFYQRIFSFRLAPIFLFFSVILFLCHPLQTESVTYTSQRSTLIASLCYLLSLFFYVLYRRDCQKRWYIFSLGVALVGVFSKPIIVTLPLAVILCEMTFFQPADFDFKTCDRNILPFFLIAGIVPVLLVFWQHHSFDFKYLFDATRETEKYTRQEYLFTQFNVLMTYLRLLVFPMGQNLDYDYPLVKSIFSFPTYLSLGALIFSVVFALKVFKTQRLVAFAVLWFFLTLSLESSIFPIADLIFEHRLYLPIIGFAILVPVALKRIIGNEILCLGVLVCIVVLFSTATYRRNQLWNDKIRFLTDIAKKSPKKPRAHNNLGVAYFEGNHYAEAEGEYRIAISIDKKYAHSHNNLGIVCSELGKVAEAVKEFELATNLDPQYASPLFNLGNLYGKQGDFERAKEYFQKALRIRPYFAQAYAGLGKVSLEEGEIVFAKSYFLKSLELNPGLSYSYHGLGDVYLKEGNYQAALAAYKNVVNVNPASASAYNNIGNILDMYGQYVPAIENYQKAIVANPRFANAYFNLANTLKKMGDFKKSQEVLKTATIFYKEQNNDTMARTAQERLQELSQ